MAGRREGRDYASLELGHYACLYLMVWVVTLNCKPLVTQKAIAPHSLAIGQHISRGELIGVNFICDQPQHHRSRVVNKAVEKDHSWYVPLYKAAIKGDWEGAKRFLELERDAVTARITTALDTTLLVSATEKSIYFMEQLVELMQPEELALANGGGDAAFHLIAGVGNIEAAKLLHKKNSDLPNKWNAIGMLPLHFPAMVGHKDMILYLLNIANEYMEPKPFEDQSGSLLVSSLITSGLLDVVVYLLKRYPKLAVANPSPLNAIAQKPFAFPSGSHLNFWQQLIYTCIPLILEKFLNIQDGDVESPAKCSQSCAEVCHWFPML